MKILSKGTSNSFGSLSSEPAGFGVCIPMFQTCSPWKQHLEAVGLVGKGERPGRGHWPRGWESKRGACWPQGGSILGLRSCPASSGHQLNPQLQAPQPGPEDRTQGRIPLSP